MEVIPLDKRTKREVALFDEGKKYRRNLAKKTLEFLQVMMDSLPSNYISDIPATNYAIFQKAIANESARLRLAADDVFNDAVEFSKTRAEFLYQILGYRLHGVDIKFSPPGYFTDEKYREFLLSLLDALFGGSIPSNLLAGTRIFAPDLPIKLVELFLISHPLVKNAVFGISDQWRWRFDLYPKDNKLSQDFFTIQRGLKFWSTIIKPAHTLFQIRTILKETIKTTAGCRVVMGDLGYLRATRITKVTPYELIGASDGVIDNVAKGVVSELSGNGFKLGTVRVKFYDDTIFVGYGKYNMRTQFKDTQLLDLGKKPLRFLRGDESDFQILRLGGDYIKNGDSIIVEGYPVDNPYLHGFPILQKLDPTAICVNKRFKISNYFYEDMRKVCDISKTPLKYTYDWYAFETRYSSILNSRVNLVLNDFNQNGTTRMTLNDFNVVDSKPLAEGMDQFGPDDIHTAGSTVTLNEGTPLFPKTQELVRDEFDFKSPTRLNDNNDKINQDFKLNEATIVPRVNFRSNLYSNLHVTKIDNGGESGVLSIACDELKKFIYTPPGP